MKSLSLNSFQIDFNRDLLGKGKHGYVYKAFYPRERKYYALKIILENENDQEQYKKIFREYQIMFNVKDYPNLEKIYGYFTDFFNGKNCFCLLLEFIEGENLNNKLEKYYEKNRYIEQDLIIKIIYDIANGLRYLHKNNIIHRDIAPDNIMIDNNNNIKITDFGLSAYYQYNGDINSNLVTTYSIVGRALYVGNEIIKKKESGDKSLSYGIKNDIFAFGVTMFYLMTFAYPEIVKKRKKEEEIIKLNFEKNINDKIYNKNIIELVMSMLEEDENKRPTCDEIMIKLTNIRDKIIPSFNCAIDCLRSFEKISDYLIKNENNNKLKSLEYSFIKNFILCLKNSGNLNLFISSFYEKISIYGFYDVLYPIDVIKIIFDYFLTNSPFIFDDEKENKFLEKSKNNKSKFIITDKIKEFNNIFVSIFYFSVLKTYKCQKCKAEIGQDLDIKYSLDLFKDNNYYKISDLITNFYEKKNYLNLGKEGGLPSLTCKGCGMMSKLLDEYNEILDAPDVLIINLMFVTELEEYININIKNEGEIKYDLHCVIFYNFNESTYEYAIKNNKKWTYYRKEGQQSLDYKNIVNIKGAKTVFYTINKNEFSLF